MDRKPGIGPYLGVGEEGRPVVMLRLGFPKTGRYKRFSEKNAFNYHFFVISTHLYVDIFNIALLYLITH